MISQAPNPMSMQLPTISQYADSITNPAGLLRSLDEFEAERDVYGKAVARVGNNASVFRVTDGGGDWMIKCYFKRPRNSETIYSYLASLNDDPLISPSELLKDELYIYDAFGEGRFHDVVRSRWVEGNTLETEIRRAVNEGRPGRIKELSVMFDDMARNLLTREWAHGDLKPENIIVSAERPSMVLIDYDAMFLPSLAGSVTTEVGTPAYQHPSRDENTFDKTIDDYPAAIISVSLRALALDISLYGRHNRSDNIILYPDEILEGRSEAYGETLDIFARCGDHASYCLALQLESPGTGIPSLGKMLSRNGVTSNLSGSCASPALTRRGGLWGYADRNGKIVIHPIYEEAQEFSEGLAVVRLRGMTQVIDVCGNVVIGARFDSVKPFSCGLAAVCREGKWGYINRAGETVMLPAFESASMMHEGRAAVKLNGKWGFIDGGGEIVIAPVYDHATGFRNDCATVVKRGQTLRIDRSGNIIT